MALQLIFHLSLKSSFPSHPKWHSLKWLQIAILWVDTHLHLHTPTGQDNQRKTAPYNATLVECV